MSPSMAEARKSDSSPIYASSVSFYVGESQSRLAQEIRQDPAILARVGAHANKKPNTQIISCRHQGSKR
jgi:hypothetical protein